MPIVDKVGYESISKLDMPPSDCSSSLGVADSSFTLDYYSWESLSIFFSRAFTPLMEQVLIDEFFLDIAAYGRLFLNLLCIKEGDLTTNKLKGDVLSLIQALLLASSSISFLILAGEVNMVFFLSCR